MPITKKQKKLFGWVYACKTGKTKRCPSNIKKIGKNISVRKLKKCLKESTYIIEPTSKIARINMLNFLIEKNIKFLKFRNFLIIEKNPYNIKLIRKKFPNKYVKITLIIDK